MVLPESPSSSPPVSPASPGELDYGVVLDMVQKINSRLGDINLDTERIRSVCDGLLRDYRDRDAAIGNLTRLVKETLDRPASHQPHRDAVTPHPIVRPDLIDDEGNLRAADIGMTWQGSDTFVHGVKVVGPNAVEPPLRPQPATSTPYVPAREHVLCHMSMPPPVQPSCLEVTDRPLHRTTQESRQGYRPATPIQRFNNKSLNWPSWFRHFKVVAAVHGWDRDQHAFQLVSYLDETAVNVVQELADDELYDYDILVKLLCDRFDPASRVSASRSRFHGRLRRHHEDADAYADAITELCRVGYPQSSPELRQELISEQLVRGQSDPELKKYLWVIIRTQKERKLQTLIEVCTDSLGQTTTVHRPAEQVFALEEDDDPEYMVTMMDHSQWTGQGATEPNMPPSLQQMFTLARRMGYEMRPIARRTGATRQAPSSPRITGQGYRAPFRPGRDYSKVKCFSCSHMGHTQARCPKPDSSLTFRPDGWNTQPDGTRPTKGNDQHTDGPTQANDV